MNDMSMKNESIGITSTPEFADSIAVLYAPLKNYVPKVLSLMLRHCWQEMRERIMSPADALSSCGWLGRLITLDARVPDVEHQHNIRGWSALKEHLVKSLGEYDSEAEFAVFADDFVTSIRPILAERFIENYHFPEQKFYCWWYTIHDNNTHLALHLINAYQPASPFDHLGHFLATMLRAIEHGVAAHPDIEIVSCGSWLNQFQKFQQLWPGSFKNNQRILNASGGNGPGAWGQYMTTNGGYNEARAAVLLATGKHPYALTEASAPVAAVKAHLKELIS
jgi:hypothetical protein